jgi:hypothetical protein
MLAISRAGLAPDSLAALGSGWAVLMSSSTPRAGLTITDSLLRLSPGLFQVFGTTTLTLPSGAPVARDAVRELLEFIAVDPPDSGAISSIGPVLVEGSGAVVGDDTAGTGACGSAGGVGTGVIIAPAASIAVDSANGGNVSGTPAVATDSLLTPGLLDSLLPTPFRVLMGAANHQLVTSPLAPRPVAAGVTCDTLDPLNWGDPAGTVPSCAGYRPIMAIAPGTTVRDGLGQGVVLATGGATFAGGFRFDGIVIARGVLTLADSTSITGVLLAADSVVLRGRARVARSVCASRQASSSSRRIRPLPVRAWSHGP